MSDNSIAQKPASGLKSTELWTLLGMMTTNIVMILVITGRMSEDKGDSLNTTIQSIMGVISTFMNLYGWKWYAEMRTRLKEAHISASTEVKSEVTTSEVVTSEATKSEVTKSAEQKPAP